jgi:hypothetical protein
VSLAAKQKSHRPGQAPALGLRAGSDGVLLYFQTASERRPIMSLHQWFRRWPAQPRHVSRPPRRGRLSLRLEQLEDRMLPSTFTAATVSDLIADINAANTAGGTNTITLAPKVTFTLTQVNNTTDGATGLPVVANNDNLTIVGNGDTIERSTKSGTPDFRLFDVASGASLTLESLTLQNGYELGSGSSAEGGGIYNLGSLVLSGVTVQNNVAVGSAGANAATANSRGGNGQDAAGGGIWSNGALTLENSTAIQNNNAEGGNGGSAFNTNYGSGPITSYGGNGGNGFGAGLDIAGGTANLSGGTWYGNNAMGGQGGSSAGTYNGKPASNGGQPGSGYGGGLYAVGVTLTLSSTTVQANNATSAGGGLYIYNSTASLSGNIVQSNGTGYDGAGGGIFYYINGTTALLSFSSTNDTVVSNTGGGIFIEGSSAATVSNDTVEHNTAGSGISISQSTQSTATLSYDTVDFNSSGESGGGISIGGGTTTLSNDMVVSNTAGFALYGFGGGISVEGPATVTFSNDTVASNTVGTGRSISYPYPEIWGGGIYLSDLVTATFNNDIVENNTALGAKSAGGAYGGGIYITTDFQYPNVITLCNVTVQGNTADNGGGIYITPGVARTAVYVDSFSVANTINNTDNSGTNGSTANIDGPYILKNC